MAYDKLLLVDFETTGLSPVRHEIIEIGAILCNADSLSVISEYEQKLKPNHIETAHPEALKINGYSPELWEDAVSFSQGFTDFYSRLDSTMVFTGQNVWFDVGFYLEALSQIGLKDPLDYHRLDIASMVFPFLPGIPELSLKKTAPLFGVEPEPVIHRAINGARTTLSLLREIRRRGAVAGIPPQRNSNAEHLVYQ